MNETDVKDSKGNIIISPGLKVRHKDSQFEYTVDQVLKEPSGDEKKTFSRTLKRKIKFYTKLSLLPVSTQSFMCLT